MNRRRAPLVGLLTAELVSLVGSRMSMVALPWFTLVTTGSATRTGLVAFAEMLPYVLACGLGGPLLDRIGARRVSVLADLASAGALVAVPLLYRLDRLPFGTLLALIAAVGLLRGFGDTAKRVVFPETVTASGMALTRATALHDGLSRLATLLGAAFAGILIAALDATTVLALDAASFLVAAVVVAAVVPTRVRPAPDPDRAPATDPGSGARTASVDRLGAARRYLASLAEGLHFLRREPLAGAVTLLLFVTNLADAGYTSVLAPLWAREVAGTPTALGVLSASFATGAVLGNVVFTAVAPRVPRFAVFTVGFLIAGAPRFVALAAVDRLWAVYLVSFVAGLSIAAINPILGAVIYERVPEELRARVLGPAHAISWAGIPLGGLLAGWAAAGLALPVACLLFGGAYLLVTLMPFVAPAWRELDRPPSIGSTPDREPSSVAPTG